MLAPHRAARPRSPVLGSSSNNPIVVDSAERSHHVIVTEPPASPDPSPPSSPIDTPTKRRAPSPPVSPSKVLCEAPRYVEMQSHQFECPECPLPSSPTLNGHFEVGMLGEVWPMRSLPSSLQRRPAPRARRPAPSLLGQLLPVDLLLLDLSREGGPRPVDLLTLFHRRDLPSATLCLGPGICLLI